MPAPPYYRWFVGDFLRDCAHLSLLEQGVYRALIDRYMILRGPLPFDLPRLYRYLHATSKEEQSTVQAMIEEFFKIEGDLLRLKRCDRELEWQDRQTLAGQTANCVRWEREKARKAADGKTEENQPSNGNGRNPDGVRSDSDRYPYQNQNQNQNQRKEKDTVTTSQPKTADAVSVAEEVGKPPQGPHCPFDRIHALWHELLPLNPRWERTAARDAKIACRWREQEPESADAGVEWFRWFFETKIGKSAFLTGRAQTLAGRKPFRASVDFVFRSETQFLKIYEGEYA